MRNLEKAVGLGAILAAQALGCGSEATQARPSTGPSVGVYQKVTDTCNDAIHNAVELLDSKKILGCAIPGTKTLEQCYENIDCDTARQFINEAIAAVTVCKENIAIDNREEKLLDYVNMVEKTHPQCNLPKYDRPPSMEELMKSIQSH